jgi:hypothetical protein
MVFDLSYDLKSLKMNYRAYKKMDSCYYSGHGSHRFGKLRIGGKGGEARRMTLFEQLNNMREVTVSKRAEGLS